MVFYASNVALKANLGLNQLVADGLKGPGVQSGTIGALLKGFSDELQQNIAIDGWASAATAGCFEAMKLNWYRFQLVTALPSTTAIIPGFMELSNAATEILNVVP